MNTAGYDAGIDYLTSLPEWNGRGVVSLGAMERLMTTLGSPQDSPRSVHVAGTNGKGSVSAGIAAMLNRSGKRVGLNLSPHLSHWSERFVIDGRAVSEEMVSAAANEVGRVASSLRLKLTRHEAYTAVAFLLFQHLDFAVMEVGLGGRLDASNVIRSPELSVIVTIDYDHQAILGNTLEQIALEKAGIIKEGRPVVTGALPKEALNVISRVAKERRAPLYALPEGWAREGGSERSLSVVELHNREVALLAARLLGLSREPCERAWTTVSLPGRWERLFFDKGGMAQVGSSSTPGGGGVVFDCAHNVAGVRALATYLRSRSFSGAEIVFGVVGDKEWQRMIDLLLPAIGNWSLVPPDSPRALDIKDLHSYLREKGIKPSSFTKDYRMVVEHIRGRATGLLPVVVAGSSYLVGPIRAMLAGKQTRFWGR